MPTVPFAIGLQGKPLNVGDACTIVGTITNITGSGANAVVTVTLVTSGLSISANSGDLYSKQTL